MDTLRSFQMFSKEAFNTFFNALDVTWKGMAGVFIVMTLLFVAILLLGKIRNDKEGQ